MTDDSNSVSVFQAPPPSERKTISIRDEKKISHPNLIPDDLLEDEFLNALINEGLPRNYNFEVHKTIWKIRQTNAKVVLLQFPEGLIRFGPVLVDIMTAYFDEVDHSMVRFITMGDLTYGACCIDDYLASSMGCDLIVHYAHSCLVPISQLTTSVKYLYIFLDIKFDLDHVISCIKHNFKSSEHNITLASTIQFVSSVHEVARQLKLAYYNVTLSQSRPLSSGEVLGCTAPKLEPNINTIIFICDGRFHLEALMIANPKVAAYRYDPYSRKLTHETYNFEEMFNQRVIAIRKAVQVMREGGTFGFVLGTLGRQGNESVYSRLVEQLEKLNSNCKYVKLLLPEVTQDNLEKIDSVDVWVQVACPRLSIDWGSFFKAPLLNSYEFAQSVKAFSDPESQTLEIKEKMYPMDFYAKHSCGDHTPNHTCLNNQNCRCLNQSENKDC